MFGGEELQQKRRDIFSLSGGSGEDFVPIGQVINSNEDISVASDGGGKGINHVNNNYVESQFRGRDDVLKFRIWPRMNSTDDTVFYYLLYGIKHAFPIARERIHS